MRRRHLAALAVLGGCVGWTAWSYRTDGLIAALLAAPESGTALEAIRSAVLAWGSLAPLIYVALVTLEVVVAPLPGVVLYAPGGAIFGGFLGGTLSLVGNVVGAAVACWLGATFGADWVARHAEGPRLEGLRHRLTTRGAWVVFLLRLNPFTSSDIVSYAAGAAGVPVRRVALGTAGGMAPLCYAQAYLAATVFELLPGSPAVLLGAMLVITVVVGWLMLRGFERM